MDKRPRPQAKGTQSMTTPSKRVKREEFVPIQTSAEHAQNSEVLTDNQVRPGSLQYVYAPAKGPGKSSAGDISFYRAISMTHD